MSTITYSDVVMSLIGGAVVYASQYLPKWRLSSAHKKPRRQGSRRRRRSESLTNTAKPATTSEQEIAKTWPELPYLVQVFRDNAIAVKPQTPQKRLRSVFYTFRKPSAKRLNVQRLRDEFASATGRDPAQIIITPSVPGQPNLIGIELMDIEMISSDTRGSSPLTFQAGLDDYGQEVIADIAVMPHLLVAGPSGTGKSSFINAMLLSLIEKKNAQLPRLIIIDPKGLDFGIYGGDDYAVPHLAMPIITDKEIAVMVIDWVVNEMERRYQVIQDYCKAWREQTGEHLLITKLAEYNEHAPVPMPYYVILIDEIADLMLTHGERIEALLQRLGQKARAAGMHMILATQRPDADTIPMSIRSNFSNGGLCFKVPDSQGSTAVLGQGNTGAVNLPPMGVALFNHNGLKRIHCQRIEPDEMVKRLQRLHEPPNYIELAGDVPEQSGTSGRDELNEELKLCYDIAVKHLSQGGNAGKNAIKDAIKLSRGTGIGDPKYKKVRAALELDGVV